MRLDLKHGDSGSLFFDDDDEEDEEEEEEEDDEDSMGASKGLGMREAVDLEGEDEAVA